MVLMNNNNKINKILKWNNKYNKTNYLYRIFKIMYYINQF